MHELSAREISRIVPAGWLVGLVGMSKTQNETSLAESLKN